MPVAIPATLADNGDQAASKAAQTRNVPKYLFSSALAGLYVGIAVVLLISTSAGLAASSNPATKLVQGAVFGIALTLVVFAGAELFTGNAMVMVQGFVARQVGAAKVATVLVLSLIGNLIGSVFLAALVHGAGTFASGPTKDLLGSMTATKMAASGPQLFWRAVLCNLLVCLGLWMAARTKSDAAKLAVLWWALLAFIAAGFEHSIANMTIFGIAALQGTVGWGDLASNLVWTVPGNVVGGGLIVGLGYAWIGHQRSVATDAPLAAETPPLTRSAPGPVTPELIGQASS